MLIQKYQWCNPIILDCGLHMDKIYMYIMWTYIVDVYMNHKVLGSDPIFFSPAIVLRKDSILVTSFSSTKNECRSETRILEGWNVLPCQVSGPSIPPHSFWVAGRFWVLWAWLCWMTQLRWRQGHRARMGAWKRESKWEGGRAAFSFWGSRWFSLQMPAKGKFPLVKILWGSVK